MSDTPETDMIVRNAKIADHSPARLAATLTVKCEKLERERDEARKAFVIATDQMVIAQGKVREANKERDEAREIAEQAIDDLAWFNETNAQRLRNELEQLKEETK